MQNHLPSKIFPQIFYYVSEDGSFSNWKKRTKIPKYHFNCTKIVFHKAGFPIHICLTLTMLHRHHPGGRRQWTAPGNCPGTSDEVHPAPGGLNYFLQECWPLAGYAHGGTWHTERDTIPESAAHSHPWTPHREGGGGPERPPTYLPCCWKLDVSDQQEEKNKSHCFSLFKPPTHFPKAFFRKKKKNSVCPLLG